MNRGALSLLALVSLAVGALYFGRTGPAEKTPEQPALLASPAPRGAPARLASLSPAVTDTIVALGARASLAVVSDYCDLRELPRAGTIISPHFEVIAAARPDLIVATTVAGSADQDLKRLAPLLTLPWFGLDEVTGSIRRLGEAIGRTEEAERLATQMQHDLRERAPIDAPEVLLLMGPIAEDRVGYFYIRSESLHGRLLTASGYRNAMGTTRTAGPPRLSVEELLRVNPDAVLVLQETPAGEQAPLSELTPLEAVQKRRTGVLTRVGILSMGPDILDVRKLVEAALDRMFQAAPP